MDLGQRLRSYLAPLSAIMDATPFGNNVASSALPAGSRLSALVVLPNATQDARHEYLDTRGGDKQDIRYQIASHMGVSLCYLMESTLKNGAVAFYVNWIKAIDGTSTTLGVPPTMPAHNERASFLLDQMVYGPVFFLHTDAHSNCGYSSVRPELLKTPDVTPFIASRAFHLDVPPTLEELLTPPVSTVQVNNTDLLATSATQKTPETPPIPRDTTHKTGTWAGTTGTRDPKLDTVRSTSILRSSSTPLRLGDTPDNNSNTSNPSTPLGLMRDKAEKTIQEPPRPERSPAVSRKRERNDDFKSPEPVRVVSKRRTVSGVRRSSRLARKKTPHYAE